MRYYVLGVLRISLIFFTLQQKKQSYNNTGTHKDPSTPGPSRRHISHEKAKTCRSISCWNKGMYPPPLTICNKVCILLLLPFANERLTCMSLQE